MSINQKDEVEIDAANLKDFLENDVKGIEFILNSEDFMSDLEPKPIPKPIEKKPIHKESNYEGFFDYYKKIKENKNL